MALKLVDKFLSFMGFEEENEAEERPEAERSQQESIWYGRREKEKEKAPVLSIHAQRQVRVVVVEPRSFDDVKSVADNLKNRRPVVINLEAAEGELARRVVDFVSGAAYALGGGFQKVGSGIFLVVPSNMDITGDFKELEGERNAASWSKWHHTEF